MAYYGGQGDYYRGVGDPGLFDFVGKGLGAALHFIPGVGPALGAAGSIIGKALSRGASKASVALAPALGTVMIGQTMARHQAEQIAAQRLMPGIPAARGHRLGKVPAHLPKHLGGLGHRRRMNVANVKALRRSVRRLLGFYHLSHQVMKSLGVLARKHHVRAPSVHHVLPSHRHKLLPPARGDFYQGDFL